jgi:hypothetical protein
MFRNNFIKNSAFLLCLLAPSFWMIATVPPLWRDIDAYLQVTERPLVSTFWGHGPAYCYAAKVPLFIGEHVERWQGKPSPRVAPIPGQPALTDTGVLILVGAQHLALAAAVFCLIRAVSRKFWVRLVLSLLWASNSIFYTFAHCVGTETLSMILIVLLVWKGLALVRSEPEPRWIDWYAFAVVLLLCILTRHLNLLLVGLLPGTFLLAFISKRVALSSSGQDRRVLLRQMAMGQLRRAFTALAIGVACAGIAGSLAQNLARKTRLHPHSRLGYTFLWRLDFLRALPLETRIGLLQKVKTRAKSPEARELIGLRDQMEKEGADLDRFQERAMSLLFRDQPRPPWEKLDVALNQMAFAFLLPPTPEHARAALNDFGAALSESPTRISTFLFTTTTYYFTHRDEMPACTNLALFREMNARQIELIPTRHTYFQWWRGLNFRWVLQAWSVLILLCGVAPLRNKKRLGARVLFGAALTGTGLSIVAATCLLDEYFPRFGLPMWELVFLSLLVLLGELAQQWLGDARSGTDPERAEKVRRAAVRSEP